MSRECPYEYPFCVRVNIRDKGYLDSSDSNYCYSGFQNGIGNARQIEPGFNSICTDDNRKKQNEQQARRDQYQQQL